MSLINLSRVKESLSDLSQAIEGNPSLAHALVDYLELKSLLAADEAKRLQGPDALAKLQESAAITGLRKEIQRPLQLVIDKLAHAAEKVGQ